MLALRSVAYVAHQHPGYSPRYRLHPCHPSVYIFLAHSSLLCLISPSLLFAVRFPVNSYTVHSLLSFFLSPPPSPPPPLSPSIFLSPFHPSSHLSLPPSFYLSPFLLYVLNAGTIPGCSVALSSEVCLIAQDTNYTTTACVTLYFIGLNSNTPTVTYTAVGVASFTEGQAEAVSVVSGTVVVEDPDHPTR